MQLLSTLAVLASVVALGAAIPTPGESSAPSKHFRLKTQVTEGRKDLDNSYVNVLPAGTEGKGGFKLSTAIVAQGSKKSAAVFHFLGSQLITSVKGVDYGLITFFPNDSTASFKTVQIDENSSETGFEIHNGQLINFDNNNSQGPWVACFWDHAIPEIFEVLGDRENADYLPPNCARVALVPEYVS